jgi:hypothetical protein
VTPKGSGVEDTFDVGSGTSMAQVFDVTVAPGTLPTADTLVYSLFNMLSVVDMSHTTEGVRLSYTCT